MEEYVRTFYPDAEKGFILVVEDDEAIRELIQDILKNNGWHRVMTAKNGEEAFELYLAHKDSIPLIICDYDMPRMNGAQLFRKLRSDNTVRFLMCSGSQPPQLGELETCGLAGFVQKPFMSQELMGAIQIALL
jgi:two-component system chemotaxis response regulator CheY